jgi:hypothetical protein
MVGSQTVNLTPNPSFSHNLCFKCPNRSSKPILDIYVLRAFRWYKELFKTLSFGPYNHLLKIWECTETPSPKVGIALGMWRFIPSQFPTFPGACSVTPGLPFGPQPYKPLCLGHKYKARAIHFTSRIPLSPQHCIFISVWFNPDIWSFHMWEWTQVGCI